MTAPGTAARRRAMNQVWNGAGEYGIEPLFLALDPEGEPELYLNTIVGCVHKWYGKERPQALFSLWEGDRRQALLDDLAWLMLENGVFALETPERPVLPELRQDYGARFLAREHSFSRQQWMVKNQLNYTMQAARWRSVLGRRPPFMTPYERRLSKALGSGGTDWDTLSRNILDTFARFGLFYGKKRPASVLRLRLGGRLGAVMRRLVPGESSDSAKVEQSGGAEAGNEAAPREGRGHLRPRRSNEEDSRYMESCFGPSLLSQQERLLAEQTLCVGNHSGCHLWYCAGVPTPERAPNGESRRLAQEAQEQARRNREAFAAGGGLYQNAIRRLAEEIRNCLQVHSQTKTETARRGKLDTARVWRGPVMGDGRIFTREHNSPKPDFTVDLLLDASASRLRSQELLAAQGVILSESLTRCGIGVRVFGYSSLRGYTVLRRLKDYAGSSREIFRYFATGWNRDGLALRATAQLPAPQRDQKRLLLVLTDGAPSDSRRIAPGTEHPLGCDYDGEAGVEDTAQAVRALQKQSIRIGAIFMGPGCNLPGAKRIYGEHLVRVRTMDELAAAAGQLIREEIRTLE